jgi:hypothetical protein
MSADASNQQKSRFNVDFSPEALSALNSMAEWFGSSKSEVVRKGLSLLKFYVEMKSAGKRFLVVDEKTGEQTEIIDL